MANRSTGTLGYRAPALTNSELALRAQAAWVDATGALPLVPYQAM